MSEKIGKVKETVGWATGDREVEAKGRIEQEVADPARPEEEVTGDAVAGEEAEVRQEHGDYEPEAT